MTVGRGARRAVREPRRPSVACAAAVSLLVAVAGGCAPEGDTPAEAAGVARAAIGEPTDGFPMWAERASLVWTNRARCDPEADLASCTVCAEAACYSPVQPLVWHHGLGRAARFHSDHLGLAGCSIQHDSPCELVTNISDIYDPGSCDGSVSCACESGTHTCGTARTAWNVRITRFAGGVSSENISSSPDPVLSHYLFLHEPDSDSSCGFRHANGHRYNILSAGNRAIGIGIHTSGGPLTQDFLGSGTPDGLVSGVHYPQSGSTLEFRANWYGGDPSTAWVNLDGTCHVMALERGTRTNGTYHVELSGISGCRTYYFHFTEGGTEHYYPTTGSYGIGCGFDWTASREPPCAGCDPDCAGYECGDDGCGGSCGTCSGGKSCSSGVCVCPSGTRDCSGACVNTSTDPAHCGGCGVACAAGEVCTGGSCVCVPDCAGRQCGDDSCGGSCGACTGGASCDGAGHCVCPSGQTDCSGTCADLTSDRTNCGACGTACAVGEGCVSGTCTHICVPDCTERACGDDGCGGSCGSCASHLECDAEGHCLCPGGLTDCGSVCVDTATDHDHCGDCATACADGEGCEAGVCFSCTPECGDRECGDDGCGGSCGGCGFHMSCSDEGTCECWEGLALCDGTCVDVTADVDNCGGCDAACEPAEICYFGVCMCIPWCEGLECGSDGCGGSCGSCDDDRLCVEGLCSCAGGESRCGDECVDLRTEEAHCGACSVVCEPAYYCVAGRCQADPPESCEPSCEGRDCGDDGCGGSCGDCPGSTLCAEGGQCFCPEAATLCGDECVDTRTNDEHCGGCDQPCGDGRCVRGECTGEGPTTEERGPGPFVPAQTLPGVEGGWSWGCDCRAAGPSGPPLPAGLLLLLLAAALRGLTRR